MIERTFALWQECLPLQSDTWAVANSKPKKTQIASTYDGLAVLEITGTLLHGSTRYRWDTAVSLDDIVAELNLLRMDGDVSRVLIKLDSPGGTVAGTQAATNALAKLSAAKPVIIFSPALLASGALYFASAATKIFAESSALIGSIGVFAILSDSSRLMNSLGIDVHLISSGGLKGLGAAGTPVTQDLKDAQQSIVDTFAAQFVAALAKGRNVDPRIIQVFADGRMFIASQAKGNYLIDEVGSIDDALAALMALPAKPTRSQQYAQTDAYLFAMVDRDQALAAYEREREKLGADVHKLLPKSCGRFAKAEPETKRFSTFRDGL